MIYCLFCKKLTDSNNLIGKITKNNKPYISANCSVCNKLKSKFISVKEISGNGLLSNLFRNIPILNKIF